MDKRILFTWHKSGQRWKRVYRGRTFYGPRGVTKSDRQAYAVAVAMFNDWKTKVDREADADKPNAAQYQEAIRLRQSMVDWLSLERNRQTEYDEQIADFRQHQATFPDGPQGKLLDYADEYDQMVKELDRLNRDFARVNPPPLDEPGRLPVNPLRYRINNERRVWIQRLGQLEAHEQWDGTTDREKTIGANLDQFLVTKRQQADAGQIAYGWFDVLKYHLDHFRTFAGQVGVENLNANLLANYHAYLLADIQAKRITTTYAKQLLGTVKSFFRWLDESEIIERLPRNLNKLQIAADAPTIGDFHAKGNQALLAKATDRPRLYTLLMLNTGMTGKDISDLAPAKWIGKQGG